VRAGARRQATSVRADDPGAGLRGDDGELRVHSAPGVVHDVGAGGQHLAGDLGAPGVDGDGQRGVRGADGGDQVDGAADLLRGVHVLAGRGLDPADVDHVRALGDHRVHAGHGSVQLEGGAPVVEGVRRPVDDGHHDQPPVGDVEPTQSQHPAPARRPCGEVPFEHAPVGR